MPGWMKQKVESRFLGEITITSDMQMTPPLWQKAKRNSRASLKVKKESEKVALKLKIQKTKIMASGPIAPWKQWQQWETLFTWAPKSLQMVTVAMRLKDTCSLKNSHGQTIKKQKHYFANKVFSQRYGFSSSHVWMCELDHKESWVPKNWCFLNCGIREDSWESLRWQGDPTSQS